MRSEARVPAGGAPSLNLLGRTAADLDPGDVAGGKCAVQSDIWKKIVQMCVVKVDGEGDVWARQRID